MTTLLVLAKHVLFAFSPVLAALAVPPEKPVVPVAKKQQDYATTAMVREWGELIRVDLKARTLTARLDKTGKEVTVPVPEVAACRFRNSWGYLEDYTPGMRVFLFLFTDEDGTWTYPEAILDELFSAARHKHYARVASIDAAKRVVVAEYPVKAGSTAPANTVTYICDPDVKVWHGAAVGGFDALKIGDEIIAQRVYRAGEQFTVEIADRAGAEAIQKAQDAAHNKRLGQSGLQATVGDREPVSGSVMLNIAPSGTPRVGELKPGSTVTVTPTDGAKPFAFWVSRVEVEGGRNDRGVRVYGVVRSYAAARLTVGQSVRLWVPGTGPQLPEGKSGLPVLD